MNDGKRGMKGTAGGHDGKRPHRSLRGARFRLAGARLRALAGRAPTDAAPAPSLPAAGTFAGVAWAASAVSLDRNTKRMP